MIFVEEITIEEFRGIRKLTLSFKSKNFAVCGPNGTGKSGVVDALEFGLTGNISRLSGAGTGAISLRKHAPHVDSRNLPENAKVSLVLRMPSIGSNPITIERNVRDASAPIISPNTPEVLEILKQLDGHPEFVLSRRELIAYVLAVPGKRSEEIQALLRLDKLGEIRSNLTTLRNDCDKEKINFGKFFVIAENNLSRALEIPELTQGKLLDAVNTRRLVLGLDAIKTLTSSTRLNDGLMAGTKSSSAPKINKIQAIADLKTARELLSELSDIATINECSTIRDQISAISVDPTMSESVQRENFLRSAIEFITEPTCPLCDTEWDIDLLRNLVGAKIKKLEAMAKTRAAIEKRIEPIIEKLKKLNEAVSAIERYSKAIAPEQSKPLFGYSVALVSKIKIMEAFLPLTKTLSSLIDLTAISPEVTNALSTVEAAVAVIPEPSQREAARDYLNLCEDRLETYREAARTAKRAADHAAIAHTILDVYVTESDKVLEGVYKQVEQEFSDFYRFINKDDESDFTARLTPSFGKLGFDVDFYGRGNFPPGAYHSEGHQDGMGLCLYLALMKLLQGGKFTFAVLDDVLMSVDTGHRREVCNLLRKHFPNTQFVLTTHDEVWLKHMKSAGLISSDNSVHFSDWTPEQGPTEWNNRNVWVEIDTALKTDDVHTAASDLRYYLEYIFKDVCQNLHARVEFKGDGRYDLGDLLCPGIKKFKDLLLCGKKAAASWNRPEDVKIIDEREKKVANSFQASNAEQWQINPAVHYNEWANLTASDFRPVAAAFHDLVQNLFCDNPECGGLYYLTFTSQKGPDSLRCACRKTNINLKKHLTTA